LDALYESLMRTPSSPTGWDPPAARTIDELDLMLSRLYSSSSGLGGMIDAHVRGLGYGHRLCVLRRIGKVSRAFSFSLLLPSSLGRLVSARAGGWRGAPLVSRWLSAGS
jgi:hypothetical protein